MTDSDRDSEADRILIAALRLAERKGWDGVHLHEVALALNLPLAHVQRHFSGKDDVADALFDRADQALLRASEAVGWRQMPIRLRLETSLLAWLQALTPYRRVARAMLRYKLQPDHPHLQVGGVLRISRTVQWWREASWLPSDGLRRELEEVVLTGIFLGTVGAWLLDGTADARHARRWLRWQLARAEGVAQRLAR